MEIKDLIEGQVVEGLAVLVEKVSTAATKNGKAFLRLTVQDKTGSIEGVLWDYDPDEFHWLKEGSVVTVNADVGSYNGARQLKYAAVQNAPALPATAFGKSTKFDVETLWSDIVDRIGGMTEPLTRYVAEEIMTKHAEVSAALKRAPAAKGVHNAWYGGLIEHVWALCQLADPVVAHYQKHYCKKISKDKVLFGLMLHDAGKIVEYDFATPAFAYSGMGVLANHIVLGPAWVYEAANKWHKLPAGAGGQPAGLMDGAQFKLERAQLMHILAAHHGKIEWGSPVAPATIEAVIVHHLDNLDAKVMHALDHILGPPSQMAGFSARSFYEKVNYLQIKE